VPGIGEGRPGDVEPAGTGQQLVGIVAGAEEVHQALELARVFGAGVGSLAALVPRLMAISHTEAALNQYSSSGSVSR
jgi:hypothetical protein